MYQAGRAFLRGMAHALDLGGVLAADRGRFAGGFEADAAALRSDWQRVMNWADTHVRES